MNNTRKSLLLPPALLAALCLAGCSASDADASRSGQGDVPSDHRVVDGVDDLTLPMDSYDLDNVRRARVQEARFKIIRECLKGFDLVMPEHDTGPIRYPRNAAYLGWLGEKEVHRHGYLGPAGQEAEEFAALDGLRMFDIPVDQDAAHTGLGASKVNGVRVPRGGCAGEAERALNAGAAGPDGSGPAKENDFKRLYSLMEDAATEGFRDERIREADARWSECMEKKGFSYGKPFDAQSDRRWQLGDSGRGRRSVSALEIKTAVADEQCRLQVDYSGVRRAAYTEAQNAIIEKNRGVLRNLKELMEKRYSNAVKILG